MANTQDIIDFKTFCQLFDNNPDFDNNSVASRASRRSFLSYFTKSNKGDQFQVKYKDFLKYCDKLDNKWLFRSSWIINVLVRWDLFLFQLDGVELGEFTGHELLGGLAHSPLLVVMMDRSIFHGTLHVEGRPTLGASVLLVDLWLEGALTHWLLLFLVFYLLVLLHSLLLFSHLSLINTGVFVYYPALYLLTRVRHIRLECTRLNMFYLLFQVIALLCLYFPVLGRIYVTLIEILHLLLR